MYWEDSNLRPTESGCFASVIHQHIPLQGSEHYGAIQKRLSGVQKTNVKTFFRVAFYPDILIGKCRLILLLEQRLSAIAQQICAVEKKSQKFTGIIMLAG